MIDRYGLRRVLVVNVFRGCDEYRCEVVNNTSRKKRKKNKISSNTTTATLYFSIFFYAEFVFYLHQAVKELLRDSRALLDPRLLLLVTEVLRSLHDADGGVVGEVGNGLLQEVRPRTKVGVEDCDRLARSNRERVAEVSRLLKLRPVGPQDVCQKTRFRKTGTNTELEVSVTPVTPRPELLTLSSVPTRFPLGYNEHTNASTVGKPGTPYRVYQGPNR